MKAEYGFFSFTEVTDPAEHRSYNEWHQLDHLPEQFPLRGIVYGQRWVSTPACRVARVVSEPALDPIHYVTCYLMTEPLDETLEEFFALGAELRRLDRFHQQRQAHLTGPFRLQHARAAPRVLVSPAAVPFRAHRGIYVIVEEARVTVAPTAAAEADAAAEAALIEIAGVAGCWTFATVEGMASRRWTAGSRRVTVCWLDDDPLAVAARLEPFVEARRARDDAVSAMTFAGPFETITPWQWDWFDRQ
jgi:hypothetical protein